MKTLFSTVILCTAITLAMGKGALAESEGDFVPLVPAEPLEEAMIEQGVLSPGSDPAVADIDEENGGSNSFRPGHHPHPHPGPIPVPIPIPVPVPVPHQYSCYASDTNGVMYQAFGRNPTLAQRRALRRCQKVALGCVARGCQ